jgi:pimeloyl-ACP methyl ester carboxylesterase
VAVATYVLIHGASSDSWYWHRVLPLLTARGHDVVAPDLPVADDSAGFEEYADTVVQAIGERRDLILVAQSMGGFTAPIVCERVPVNLMVLVAAMVPKPGESGGQWWEATGWQQAKQENDAREGRSTQDGPFDVKTFFFHDVPPEVVDAAWERGEAGQSDTPFRRPWPVTKWPDVPTRFLLCRQDRFFPADFQRRVVRERLGFAPDEMNSGHLPALAHPVELVERLETYRGELALN